MKTIIVLAAIVVLAVSISYVHAADKCYSCLDCANTNPVEQPCPSSDYECAKATSYTSGKPVIVKGCNKKGERGEVSYCDGNLCNNSQTIKSQYAVFGLIVAALMALFA